MRRLYKRQGFSLIELVIAVSISSAVLIGIFALASSMVQYEVESARKGSVTAWTMASISNMSRDIAGASVLQWPAGDGATADKLRLCTNWSRLAGPGPVGDGAQLSTLGDNPAVITYCWDGATHFLWRRKEPNTGCPVVGNAPGGCAGEVIATSVYKVLPGQPNLFTAEVHPGGPDGYGVRLQYAVGNPAQGTVVVPGGSAVDFKMPQSMSFDTKILLEN